MHPISLSTSKYHIKNTALNPSIWKKKKILSLPLINTSILLTNSHFFTPYSFLPYEKLLKILINHKYNSSPNYLNNKIFLNLQNHKSIKIIYFTNEN